MKETTTVKPKPIVFDCPNCDSTDVITLPTLTRFNYGSGSKAVELEVVVPVRKCNSCGFEYTDSVAEDLRHEAICRHLGVMTPLEVEAIRKKYKFTRAEFAQLSRIGEASLARWETGELIQNAANDNYLYLLSFPDNVELLKERHQEPPRVQRKVIPFPKKFKGRGLDDAALVEKKPEALEFRLRR